MALQDKAKRLHGGRLTEGREKGKIEELLAKWKNGVVLNGAEILHDKKRDSEYVVFTCVEEPNKFFFGGSVITKFVSELIGVCGGKEAFEKEISEEGLSVQIEERRSNKTGNNYYVFEVK